MADDDLGTLLGRLKLNDVLPVSLTPWLTLSPNSFLSTGFIKQAIPLVGQAAKIKFCQGLDGKAVRSPCSVSVCTTVSSQQFLLTENCGFQSPFPVSFKALMTSSFLSAKKGRTVSKTAFMKAKAGIAISNLCISEQRI